MIRAAAVLALALFVATLSAGVGVVEFAHAHAWVWAAICGAFMSILGGGCLYVLQDALERRFAAAVMAVRRREAAAALEEALRSGAPQLDWDDICCLIAWMTDGRRHDAHACREHR